MVVDSVDFWAALNSKPHYSNVSISDLVMVCEEKKSNLKHDKLFAPLKKSNCREISRLKIFKRHEMGFVKREIS